MKMTSVSSITTTGWALFSVISLVAILFCIIFSLRYRSNVERSLLATIFATFGLLIALVLCCILPVDIFLISVTKYPNGTYKEWAQDEETRQTLENGVLYTYYTLYSLMSLFVFVLLPLAFFFYDDIYEEVTATSRLCTAAKYSMIPFLFGVILFLIGAFVPFKKLSSNTTFPLAQALVEDINIHHQRWENAISFVMSALTAVGMVFMILYTGYGMAAWPMDLVKGRRSVSRESERIADERQNVQSRIDAIRDKYGQGEAMSRRDRRRMEDLEDQLHKEVRRERYLAQLSASIGLRCDRCLHPLQIVFGVLFFLLAVLVVVSLIIVNIDKILHSGGYKHGYILPTRASTDPLDILLTYSQKVFPVDYIIMILLVTYFFFCTMAAFRDLGIRCCCVKLYKVKPFQTRPQALVLLSLLLMLIVLALVNIIYQLAPSYTTFGFQHYLDTATNKTEPCTIEIMKNGSDKCAMTRMSLLITRFAYTFWFFAASYYWLSWMFLLVLLLSFVVTLIRKRRSLIEGAVDNDSISDSDEELLSP